MKRFISLSLLFSLLLTGISYRAEAQFFRRLFGGKKKQKTEKAIEPVKKKTAVTPKKKTEIIPKKKTEIDYPKTVFKAKYRVDVFAHLYLDELVIDGKPAFKGKLPDKATNGLDFYEGVKLAADTLNAMGYDLDIHIHDVTIPTETPTALINSKQLDSTDLIIGAVNNNYITTLASFAAKKKINFVSALSPSDAGVKNNPYFILLQPSLQSHCEWIMETISKKYKNKTPVLLYRTSVAVDSNALNYLKITDGIAKKVACNVMPSKEKLAKLFDSTTKNLVIVAVMDVSYAEGILKQLHDWFPRYDFEVYGMPSWKSMSDLRKPEAFPNVATYITAPFYFDLSTGAGQAVANGYKRDVGGAKPNDMVFRGYETMFWYAYLLNKYGTVFNEKFSDNGFAPFTRYNIKPKWDKDENLLYQENRHIMLYRYQSSSFIVEQ